MKTFKILFYGSIMFAIYSCSNAQSNSSIESGRSLESNATDDIVIGKKVRFFSETLGEEKVLYISLPPLYDEHVQDYPVVFTFEAEYLFEVTNTTTKYMASRSKMPESIVVGIANGEFDKRRDMSYERWSGLSDEYIQFFKNDLIPYIEKNYRVNSNRTIIGLSPTTGFLFEAFMREANLFDSYIALCTHLEWDREIGKKIIDELIYQNENPNQQKSTFYMSRARTDFDEYEGSEDAFQDAINKLKNYLPDKVDISIDIIEDDEHYLMAIKGLRNGFAAIYKNEIWRDPGMKFDKNLKYGADYYQSYYSDLSAKYGFDIFPPETAHGYGFNLTGNLHSCKKWGSNEQLIELAEVGLNYFPNSANIHLILAEALLEKGENSKAQNMATKALELAKEFRPTEFEVYEKRIEELGVPLN